MIKGSCKETIHDVWTISACDSFQFIVSCLLRQVAGLVTLVIVGLLNNNLILEYLISDFRIIFRRPTRPRLAEED